MSDGDDTSERRDMPGNLEDHVRILDEPVSSETIPATFRLLIDSIKDYAIFMLDAHGIVSSWNEGAHRIKGYAAAEIIGKHFSTFYPREDVASGTCEKLLEIAAREGRTEAEGWRVRKDGSRFWANVVLTALHTESGALVGFAKVTRDLTERRMAEEARRKADLERFELEKLHEANRIKDQFLATLSHELRTPLHAIVGWAEILKSGEDPEVTDKALDTILRNAKSQGIIIDDMLDMSRIVTGKMRLELAVVDLAAIVRDAIEVVRPAADARNIRLDVADVTRTLTLVGDAVRLQQVAWNYLSNAVKFSARGGLVTVSLRRVDSSVQFSVADRGQGIGSDFLPHVFEPFRQAEEGTARRVGGVGLGLAIVKYIVELHGGTVSAESNGQGTGSLFTAIIPIRAIAPPQETASKSTKSRATPTHGGAGASLEGVRVLVVDDDADARDMLQALFRPRGAIVRLAASAQEGREAFAEFEPHIIVCDIGMPGEDGYRFLRSIRDLPEDEGIGTPAIALTAYAYERDKERALDAGFNYHLPKPADHGTLLRVMRNLLNVAGIRPQA